MKITPVQNATAYTGKIIVPNADENKKVYLMYNKVLDIVKKHQVTANIRNEGIDILPHKSAEKPIMEKLKELHIKFFNSDKK